MHTSAHAPVARAVVDSLFATTEYQAAQRISVYLSMEGKEIQTARIVKHALENKKTVFVPYIHKLPEEKLPGSVMEMLALKSVKDFESFNLDKWGIPSIPGDSITDRENCLGGFGISKEEMRRTDSSTGLDLIVMPGMAFDRQLGRLGHGKGYYDKFLSKYKERIDAGQLQTMPFLGMYDRKAS